MNMFLGIIFAVLSAPKRLLDAVVDNAGRCGQSIFANNLSAFFAKNSIDITNYDNIIEIMMKTHLKILVTIALLLMVSCQGKNEESLKISDSSQTTASPENPAEPQEPIFPDPQENPTVPLPEEIIALTGTSWELVALVDENTGERTVPYCPHTIWGIPCCSFTFEKEGIGYFHTTSPSTYLDFSKKKPACLMRDMRGENWGKENNGQLFDDLLWYIESCSYKNGELKFHCGGMNKNKYFLFIPFEERETPRVPVPDEILNLENTTFELIGLMDAATNELKIPSPKDIGTDLKETNRSQFTFYKNGSGQFLIYVDRIIMDFSRNPVVGWMLSDDFPVSAQTKTLIEFANTIDSCKYESESEQLKLFCKDKQHYFLFTKRNY